jgi:hypothetical protein
VPVIGAGAAANAWGLVTAGVVFSAAVAALALISLALLLLESRDFHEEKASENSS